MIIFCSPEGVYKLCIPFQLSGIDFVELEILLSPSILQTSLATNQGLSGSPNTLIEEFSKSNVCFTIDVSIL